MKNNKSQIKITIGNIITIILIILLVLAAIIIVYEVIISTLNYQPQYTIYKQECRTEERCYYDCGDFIHIPLSCYYDSVTINRRRCEKITEYTEICDKKEVEKIKVLIDCTTQNNITTCGEKTIESITPEWLKENAECTNEDCTEYEYKDYIIRMG